MPPPSPLPPQLVDRPFLVAEALSLGLTPARLRAGDLRAPHRGVRVPGHLEPTLLLRCRCAALLLPPGAAVSGWTAVELLALPVPWQPGPWPPAGAQGAAGTRRPLEVAVRRGDPHPRVEGVLVRRHGFVTGTVVVDRGGVPVLHPAEAWAQRCSEVGLDDAVALGDAVLARRCPRAVMGAAAARLPTPAQRSAARRALELVRPGVGAPSETALRLAVVRSGLPEPVCGAAVPAGDHPVAWPDLSWPQALLAVEVDGLTHLEPRQRHLDAGRQRLLEDLGWVLVVLTAREVRARPDECVARLRAVLAQRWPR